MLEIKKEDKVKNGTLLPIMEAFYTLQGEGYHQGKAAYFIRLGGCDIGCHWCDVKESWDATKHPMKEVGDIVNNATKTPSKFAVITGGEPLIYEMKPLTQSLSENGFYLAVETSGAYPLTGNWHWVCLSPKKMKAPLSEFYKVANELKVVIYNRNDFKWAEEHAKKVNSDCKLYLQVEWSKRDELSQEIIEYVKENPKWNISLQTHKYLEIP